MEKQDILNKYFPVLDKGFIALVDVMGDDYAIDQAARVSYGSGTRKISDTRNLIRYLMRHHHTTPFEMCLRGDTRLPTMPCKGAVRKCKTIKEIADEFSKSKPAFWLSQLKIRTVDNNGIITSTGIKFAKKTGIKSVFKITTVGPLTRTLYASDNHPILTPTGYKLVSELKSGDMVVVNATTSLDIITLWNNGHTLKEIADCSGKSQTSVYRLIKTAGIDTNRRNGFIRKNDADLLDPRARARKYLKKDCEICLHPAQDVHHLDQNPNNNNLDNLLSLCRICHKAFHNDPFQLRIYNTYIKEITYVGEDEVYDLEVTSPNHNFVAEGFVVHNCEFKFHVRVPMDCWRQWIRHRTASVNEYSTRYSEAINACQQTQIYDWREQTTSNKQGSSGYLPHFQHKVVDNEIIYCGGALTSDEEWIQKESRRVYEQRLKAGVAREQARKDLPLSTYTVAYWKCDLHNIFNFLRLRCDSHAQKEIRDYANIMAGMVKVVCPLAFEAWQDYQFGASILTRLDKEFLDYLIDTFACEYFMGEQCSLSQLKESYENPGDLNKHLGNYHEEIGMSKRELDEFWTKFGIPPLNSFDLDLSQIKDPQYFEEQLNE